MADDVAALKSEVAQWRLSSDIKLQEYLSKMSNNVAAKTKALVDTIDDLQSEASDADVRLRNTFCEFLMLANSQFIENVRVPFYCVHPDNSSRAFPSPPPSHSP